MPEIQELADDPQVLLVQIHQCMFGLTAPLADGSGKEAPAKKPTGILTNSWTLAEKLNKQCSGYHSHAWLTGGRAARAAIYSDKLCEAICIGVTRQKEFDRKFGLKAIYPKSKDMCSYINDDGEYENVNLLESLTDTYMNSDCGNGRGTPDPVLGSVEKSPTHTDEIGDRGNLKEDTTRTAVNSKPPWKLDKAHERDGGADDI